MHKKLPTFVHKFLESRKTKMTQKSIFQEIFYKQDFYDLFNDRLTFYAAGTAKGITCFLYYWFSYSRDQKPEICI